MTVDARWKLGATPGLHLAGIRSSFLGNHCSLSTPRPYRMPLYLSMDPLKNPCLSSRNAADVSRLSDPAWCCGPILSTSRVYHKAVEATVQVLAELHEVLDVRRWSGSRC